MGRRVACATLVALALLAACDGSPRLGRGPTRHVTVTTVDEAGEPVVGASLLLVDRDKPIALNGNASITVDQPVAGVVTADGFLDEPVVLDPHDDAVRIELLARTSADGQTRRALQFGGDVMMGRRYQNPGTDTGNPLVVDADGARRVVAQIAPLMAAADASTANLETVVGDLPALDAYPAKRYLLQSPPEVLDALESMGIDFVTLGNNHAYDWQDEGVASTISHLDEAGIAWAGAGIDAAQAQAGRIIPVKGMKVGIVSATTVNGDFVNESLPPADETVPTDLADKDAWQYDERAFRHGEPGDPDYVQPDNRRPGAIWSLFEQLESSLSADRSASLWADIVDTYPELQDWVARRGHGGAALFRTAVVAAQVTALRAEGADLVVVQIHGGFQFSEVPSDFLRRAAHAAIDAGADLVVGHHPHVLQGFEWYQGHLIAYSLGNFVFDQDFLSTFPSAILRVVFEGDHLLEARVVPIMVDHYRPVPVTGKVAERVVRSINASSMLAASSDRLRPDLVGSVLDDKVSTNAILRHDGTTYRIIDSPQPFTNTYSLTQGRVAVLPACSVVRPVVGQADGTRLGLDLLGWGALDDGLADGVNDGGMHWRGDGTTRYDDDHHTYLHLESDAHASATARQVARSEVPVHRWFEPDATPLDGDPTYTVQFDVRRNGDPPKIKIVLYDVNDTDPTEEPSSTVLHQATIDVPFTREDTWRTVSLDVSDLINTEYAGIRPEAVLVYFSAPAGDSRIDLDNVRLYEWRSLADLPDGMWMPADALAADDGRDVTMAVHGCSPTP